MDMYVFPSSKGYVLLLQVRYFSISKMYFGCCIRVCFTIAEVYWFPLEKDTLGMFAGIEYMLR